MKKKPVAKKMASKAPSAKKGAKVVVVMPMMFGKKGAKKSCK